MTYVYLTIAAIVGALIVALKIQGGKLHRLQLDLLGQAIEATQAQDTIAANAAKDAFAAALRAYNDARKNQ